jgi:hypothetical protein
MPRDTITMEAIERLCAALPWFQARAQLSNCAPRKLPYLRL